MAAGATSESLSPSSSQSATPSGTRVMSESGASSTGWPRKLVVRSLPPSCPASNTVTFGPDASGPTSSQAAAKPAIPPPTTANFTGSVLVHYRCSTTSL